MSNKNPAQNEDQLLQDASTLLMFANVAAKQQQERKMSPSPPAGGGSASSHPTSNVSSQVHSPLNQAQESPKNTHFDAVRQVYVSNTPQTQTHPQSSQSQINPQSQTPQQGSQALPAFHSNHHPPALPYNVPQTIPSQPLPGTLYHRPTQQDPQSHPQSEPQSETHRPQQIQLQPSLIQTTPQTHQTKSPPLQAHSSAPVSTTSSVSGPSGVVPQQVAPAAAPASVSATVTGNTHTHKRTSSLPSTGKFNHALSPGPASVVLSRGETGVGRNNNAIIAAAALAQAADNPLPLVKREETKTVVKTEQIEPKHPQIDQKGIDGVNVETIELAKDQVKEPFIVPLLEQYRVEPDSGVIGCICGIQDDDGFTIQCDVCNRWQHCLCMDYKTNEEVPEEEEEYQCYYCDRKKWGKFDAEKARNDTITRLKLDEDSNNGDKPTNKRKVSNSGKLEDKKKRRLEDKTKERKQLTHDFPSADTNTSTVEETVPFVPSKDNELFEDGVSAESYQSTYYKLRNNDYPTHEFQRNFEALGRKFFETYQKLPVEAQEQFDITIMSLKEFKSILKLSVKLPNHENHMSEKNKSYSAPKVQIQVKAYSDSQKQKFNGISKLSLFIQANNDEQAESFEEKIPKGTPVLEYFGVLDMFSNYRDNKTNQYHIWGTTKPKVLKSTVCFVGENDTIEKADIVLDSRFVGNETRFIRKSCPSATNCEIKKFYIPETESFRFLVVTSKDIELTQEIEEEELRLPWEWDENHPIYKIYGDEDHGVEGLKVDQLPKRDRSLLMNTIDNILYFTECGCSTTSNTPSYVPNCGVFKVKKAMTYLLRSTRKISGITSTNAYKAKEDLMTIKEPSPFISWEERLLNRDKMIEARVFLPNTETDDLIDDGDTSTVDSIKEMVIKSRLGSRSSETVEETLKDVDETVLNLFSLSNIVTNKIETSVEEEVVVKPEIQRSLSEIKLKIVNNDNLEKISRALSIDANKPVNKPVEEVSKPVVKKKLSFADYKKKMK